MSRTVLFHRQERILCAALLAAVAFPGCRKGGGAEAEADRKPEAVTVQTTVALVRPMDTTVVARGTLSPGQGASARVASPIAGRLLEVNVREGDLVTAGQVLAVVDNRPQQAQSRSAAAAVSASEALAREADLAARATATDQANSVRLARLALASAGLERDNAVEMARTALQTAQTDLHKTRAGARPQEIAQAEQSVNQTRATRDRAATELERVQFLFAQGIDARRQEDDAQTALAIANAALVSAQQQADLLRAGARAEDVRAAELRVQQAQEAVTQAGTSGAAHVAQAKAALRQAEQSALQVAVKQQDAYAQRATAAQRRADYAAAQASAAYARIRAPMDGTVARRLLNPGDMADTTTPVVEIVNTRALNLVASLTTEDGMRVRFGMPARITAADLPDRVLPGRVLSVGQVDPQTNLLTVRLDVPNPRGLSKAGTFATAEIVVHTAPRAVVVPRQALVTREEKPLVFVVDADNVAHRREVVVGPEQSGMVAIVKGLAPQERVVRLGQYELSDGAKVREAEPPEADDHAAPEKAGAP